MACTKTHRSWQEFSDLPTDQGEPGRHKCAGCAYERGFNDGKARKEKVDLDLESLADSQAQNVRHKSPLAAYAMGFYDGVIDSLK